MVVKCKSFYSNTAHSDGSKMKNYHHKFEEHEGRDDFAFNFCGHLDKEWRTADELFHGGKIKLLKQPSQPQVLHKHSDAMPVETIRRDDALLHGNAERKGRERVYYSSTSRTHNLTMPKPLSPLRTPTMPLRTPTMVPELDLIGKCCPKLSSSLNSSSHSSSWYNRWKLTSISVFRNSSDGYEINKKYDHLKSHDEDVIKNLSFRCGVMVSNKKLGNPLDHHEYSYKIYQMAAEEKRKKTFLPYKNTIISCMDMNAAVFRIF